VGLSRIRGAAGRAGEAELRVELGTLQITIIVKDGEVVFPTPRMDVLQGNLKEAAPLMPDGEYRWRLTMTLENAERVSVGPGAA
jgi:hypothetical protein